MPSLSPLQRLFHDPRVLAVYERVRESPLAWPMSRRTLRQEIAEILASVDAASDDAPAAILDLACGQGTFAHAVARGRPRLRVVGLDLSPGQLARARARTARSSIGNLAFTRADATRMPFGAGVFRSVFSVTGLHQIPDQFAVVSELSRVCASGATLFAACLASSTAVWSLRRRVQDALGFHQLRGDDWAKMLDAKGFVDVHYEQRTPVWGVLRARKA